MQNQLTEQKYTCRDEQRNEIHKALIKEYESLSKRASEQKIKLYNGIFQQALADKFIYKFPLPKEPEKPLEPDKPYTLSIDGNTVKGSITAIPEDKSEVEIALYHNFGRLIPTLEIIIDLKVLIDLIDRRIVAIDKEPNKFKTETATFLFNPHSNTQVSVLKRQFTHSPREDEISLTKEQIDAIDKSLNQKLTIIWGPPGTGKTITLQGVIAELLSNGHKVIFASNTNNAIDGLLKGLIKNCPYKIFDELRNEGKIVRIGSQTNPRIKKVFGSLEVAELKSQEIQNEIKEFKNKIEKEQKEFKTIQDELKQFEYVKYLNDEIIKLTEKQKAIPSNQKLKDKINYVTQSKDDFFTIFKESSNSKELVLKAGSIAEKLKNQKSKVAGINAIVHKVNTEIAEKEKEINRIDARIADLSKRVFSFFRYKNEIKDLKEEQSKTISKFQELKSTIEAYKNQQISEIAIESELTGQFVNLLNKISSIVSEIHYDSNSVLKYLDAFNLVLKLKSEKPSWILLGEEYKVITEKLGQLIYEFTEIGRVNEETITKKYKQYISDIQKQIENNEHLLDLYRMKLEKLQKEFVSYKYLFLKSEIYWNEIKERANQLQKIIESLQTQLNSLNEKLRSIEKNIVKEAKLICCTMVKSSYDETLAECSFDTLVVDETSMVSLPQLYCTSTLVKERIILCGDHLQLQPISTSQSKVALKWLASSYYDLIENEGELLEEEQNDDDNKNKRKLRRKIKKVTVLKKLDEYLSMLSLQHRMPPKVADLIRNWYNEAKLLLTDEYKIPDDFKDFHLKGHFLSDNSNIIFIDTSSIRTYHSRTSDNSPYNLINAAIVAEITRELVEDYKVDLKNIRCISPYRAQYQLTSSLLFKFLPEEDKKTLPIIASSVHKIQGDEAPIIFYDLTDGCQGGFTGFLKTEDIHIHNVAITRTQFKLIFVGDLKKMQKLREQKPEAKFNDILQLLLKEKNSVKIIDARPIKENIFKTYSFSDLLHDDTISLTSEQKDGIMVLDGNTLFEVIKYDIANAHNNILLVAPFLTKNRWFKLKDTFILFKKRNPDANVTIITRHPEGMFEKGKLHIPAVEIMNEFVSLGFEVKISVSVQRHEKLLVIDRGKENTIIYWGSLNLLSFTGNTGELMTRLEHQELAEKLIEKATSGRLVKYQKKPLTNKELKDREQRLKESSFFQLKELRWRLATKYKRPIFAICSNDTFEKIIGFLPTNRNTYKLIPQFNRKNFVLWNHMEEIEEIISPLREYQSIQTVNAQIELFDI